MKAIKREIGNPHRFLSTHHDKATPSCNSLFAAY